ncbi:non-canonical purine NTP pyrophosphatase, partial [bacterium]|nr:non-canonical purine NTP pyrophosphatase [bacterium]
MKINKLLIATHNPGKFEEIKNRLSSLNVDIISLKDLNIKEDFEETGDTFKANAKGKAEFYYNLSKVPTLADDSGLVVDALNGEPGVKSRNWLGYRGTDKEILNHLMERMKDVPV